MNTASSSALCRARIRKAFGAMLIGIMVALSCHHASAMQRKLTFEEILQQADGVFVGTVASQSCRWGPNGKMIFTDVQFVLDEWVGGRVAAPAATGGSLVLSFAGGRMGDQACRISDVPKFETGKTYLICTKLDGRPYASPITGAHQGLFKVHKDDSSDKRYLTTYADQAVVGMGAKDLQLGPRVEGVAAGVAKLKKSKGPARGFYNVAPVPVGGNPTHKARVSDAGTASAESPAEEPAALMPMDAFLLEIKGRLTSHKAADPAK